MPRILNLSAYADSRYPTNPTQFTSRGGLLGVLPGEIRYGISNPLRFPNGIGLIQLIELISIDMHDRDYTYRVQ